MKLLLATIKTDCNYTDYAMRYLYSIVEDSPLDVDMKTYGKYELDGNIYEDIIRGQYNIVYFHCNALNERHISNVIEMIKKAAPSTAVVVGGMHVSFETRNYMKANPWVDYVIRGEGESVLFRFLKSVYEYEFDFENIPGLAYRTDEQIVVNNYDEPVEMDDLPFPYDKTDADGSVIYYESMRGSAERVAYLPHLPESRIRSLSLARVCRELRYFLVKEPEQVVFFDRCFNANSERAYRIFEYLINNDNGVTSFEFNISGENLDDETIRLLAEAREGLFIFNIDVASTNAEVLAAVGRKENIYQLMYNVTKLLQAGKVIANVSVIAGLPYETEELFARSFNKAYGLADGSPFGIKMLRLAKGTQLRMDADKYGYLYTSASPYDVIGTDHLSAEDMIRIRNISRVTQSFIGNGGFKNAFPRMLTDLGMKPYDLFSKLADYVYSHGMDNKMHKPDNLARMLFAFAHELYADFEDDLKFQILTDAIHADLESAVSEEEIIRFERKGWDLEA
ncbi:MAG: DUF4080 domain-containing protein [Mogibacterium sp.]|nr:DUF4080 domain-containing protein [Mogibacterium sp.]